MKCKACEYEAIVETEFTYRFVPAESTFEGKLREAALWRHCPRCGYGFVQKEFKDL